MIAFRLPGFVLALTLLAVVMSVTHYLLDTPFTGDSITVAIGVFSGWAARCLFGP